MAIRQVLHSRLAMRSEQVEPRDSLDDGGVAPIFPMTGRCSASYTSTSSDSSKSSPVMAWTSVSLSNDELVHQ